MASTISAGTTTTTALVYTADTSGVLQLQTNGTTTAVTIDTSQNVGIGVTPSAIASYKVLAINNSTGGLIDLMVNGTSTGYLYTDSGGLKVEGVGATPILFKTNGTTALTVDTSQNVGIGVTPSAWGTLKAIEIAGGGSVSSYNQATQLNANCYYNGSSYVIKNNGSAAGYFQISANQFQWWQTSVTSGNFTATQAMTLDNSGNLLVNTNTNNIGGATGKTAILGISTGYGLVTAMPSNGGQYYYHGFGTSAGVQTGYIASTNGVTTSYVSLSDYRLKENVAPMTGALATIAQLKPVTYNWKADGSKGQGFIAHELQAVAPDCVTGEKDAVDAEGNPVYQGIDTSFLVATLTSAIQELSAKVTALEAKVGA